MNLAKKTRRVALLALVSGAYPSVAAAQVEDGATSSPQLGDIVVTARKRSESLTSVPVAVNVVSGDTLTNSATSDLGKLDAVVPQLRFVTGNSGGGASFSIRGIGSSFIDAGLEQSVSVAIDGIQIGRGNIITQAFFDIAQIEVMKGPQALFFGKNSPAGVVSLKTENPADTFSGYVNAGYEFNADERFIEGAVSVPISDALAIRLAGRVSGMAGYLKNEAKPSPDYVYNPFLTTPLTQPGAPDPRAPNSRSYAGRLTAVYSSDDSFNAVLKVTNSRYQDNGLPTPVLCSPPDQFPTVSFIGVSVIDRDTRCDNRDFKVSYGQTPASFAAGIPGLRDGKPYTDTKSTLVSLQLHYDAGDFDISSNSGYFYLDKKASIFVVANGPGFLPLSLFEKNNTYSQEVRVNSQFDGPINATIGGYYENAVDINGSSSLLNFSGTDPATGLNAGVRTRSRAKNKTTSLFGQLRWNILPNLELAGGVRWTHENKVVRQGNIYINPIGFRAYLLPVDATVEETVPGTNYSPEVTLTWHPRPDLTVYGAYKTGYKSGGVSIPSLKTAALAVVSLKFLPEKTKGGEIGVKGYFLNRRVRAELTGYYYDYTNLQVSTYNPSAVSFFIANAASARVKGLEGSLDFKATDDLTFKAAVGYNNARYVSFPGAPCSSTTGCSIVVGPAGPTKFHDLTGKPLVSAPDWSGTVGFDYDTAISEGLRFGLNADIDFSSSYFSAVENDPAIAQPAYARINAGIRIRESDDKWEVGLIGRNLNNKFVIGASSVALSEANKYWVTVGRARQVVLQLKGRF